MEVITELFLWHVPRVAFPLWEGSVQTVSSLGFVFIF